MGKEHSQLNTALLEGKLQVNLSRTSVDEIYNTDTNTNA
jgi:hypothetical protein